MTGNIPGCYTGRILRINLSTQSTSLEERDEKFYRRYLGGSGFVAYFLLREMPVGADPLGPDNKLVFALGPMTGTTVIGNGRNAVGAKSPLTGGIVFSQVGEHWGAQLKRAGYDALIVEGKAERPVYLHIHEGLVDFRDAGHLWGRATKETQEAIRRELGDEKVRIAQIGPGGENLVRFACIMNGCYDAAGRGGMGAVMGAKNLKAIAVKGQQAPAVSDQDCIAEMNKRLFERMKSNMPTQGWIEYGTGGPEIIGFEATGGLSIRNWRDGLFPGIRKIHAGVMKDTVRLGMDACFTCPLRCKKRIGFKEPSYNVDPAYGGPEYETIAALGSNVGIDDMKAMIKGNELCNAYSLDTISTGGVIAFAMECFERGLLTTADTGGLELTWGNTGAMLACIELIARQEGFGRQLAKGTAALAKRIGRGCEAFAMHVKGVDPGHHEPRQMSGFALGFMVNPHGADHCCNMLDHKYASEPGVKPLNALGYYEPVPALEASARKVAVFRVEQFRQVLFDCLLLCHLAYSRVNYQEINALTAAVTGWDTSPAELMRTAERILTMARMFNVREGFTAEDDHLPLRYYQPKTDGLLSSGPTLKAEEMEKAKRYYYTLMGWDEAGIPSPEKMQELELT